MWRLVYGLLTSFNIMASTLAMLVLTIYIFACFAMEVIAKDSTLVQDPMTSEVVEIHFSTLYRCMVTLSQFIAMDSVAAVYMPLVIQKPLLVFFFGALIMIMSLCLMNLVTAVLVDKSLECSAMFKEEDQQILRKQVKSTLPSLIALFRKLDVDRTGDVTLAEIRELSQEDALPPKLLEKAAVENMSELFELLDVDGTGSLTQEEFLEGVLSISVMDIPVSTMQIMKHLRLMRKSIQEVGEKVAHIYEVHR